MSRIGKKTIQIPAKTEVVYKDRLLKAKGPKGNLEISIHPAVDLNIESNEINVVILSSERKSDAYQGMTRALVANIIAGVSTGFERILEVNGIGYRVEVKGDTVVLNVGYSKPMEYKLPKGVSGSVEKNQLKITGIDKQELGQIAAEIRKIRPPEPYKGKGIKYLEEHIQRKAGKTAA